MTGKVDCSQEHASISLVVGNRCGSPESLKNRSDNGLWGGGGLNVSNLKLERKMCC